MGVLFQQNGPFTDLTVFENVAFLLQAYVYLRKDVIHDLILICNWRLRGGLRRAALSFR